MHDNYQNTTMIGTTTPIHTKCRIRKEAILVVALDGYAHGARAPYPAYSKLPKGQSERPT